MSIVTCHYDGRLSSALRHLAKTTRARIAFQHADNEFAFFEDASLTAFNLECDGAFYRR